MFWGLVGKMYKIGVVGPTASVNRILSLVEEYQDELQFTPFSYHHSKETVEIIKKYGMQVNAWLFSGQIPYEIAKKELGNDANMAYVPIMEASFYKSFLEMTYEQGKLLKQVSVDVIMPTNELEEALEQLTVSFDRVYTKPFWSDIDSTEILDFHLDLWNSGKTEAVLTCFSSVYQTLKQLGIPAYWTTPTRMQIRQTLNILTEKIRASYFKDTQIGVIIIEIQQFDRIIEKTKTPYHLQYLELRFKEMIIKLCEKLNGSLIEKGNGRYFIFNTRGAIERELESINNTVHYLSSESDTTIAVGIGYGKTVQFAEMNATRALQQSKEKTKQEIVIIQENGTILELMDNQELFEYSSRTEDQEIVEKLKKGNVSAKTYNKIVAIIHRHGWSDFTVKDLADQLRMTERNARRIVTDLCNIDLLQCVGEELSTNRGRPSKLYKIQ